MDVNRSNFDDLLPYIEKCIDECDFVAIDTEFTGINNQEAPTIYDTLPAYYKKMKRGSSKFLLLQLGLVTFKYDINTDKYLHSAFNFYVFPLPVPGYNRNVNFLCQSQCMTFLASTGFDFNKVFHEGISYMTKDEEANYRKILEEKRKKRQEESDKREKRLKGARRDSEYSPVSLKDYDQQEVDAISNRIREFINTAEPNEELELGKYNSYLRRVIYNNIGEVFNGKVGFEVKNQSDGSNRIVSIVAYLRGDKEHQEARELQKQVEEEKVIKQAIGASYIIRRISESRKLVIGHNMLLDVMHIINHFLCTIPDEYKSFKGMVSVCFPRILDTKYMASCAPFQEKIQNSTLNQLISTFENPEVDVVPGGIGYSVAEDKSHEAAYDAFITGVSFLSMLKFNDIIFPANSTALKPYLNKIFVYKLADIPCMNIQGKDEKPKRDHILYVTFTRDMKTKDLENYFTLFAPISVVWINDSSAFISFSNEMVAKKAFKGLNKENKFKLHSFLYYEQTVMSAAESKQKKNSESEISARKVVKLHGCTSPKRNSNEDTSEIHNAEASTPVKRLIEEGAEETEKEDEEEGPTPVKRLFTEDTSWE